MLPAVSKLCWFEPWTAREMMGSVGDTVEAGMGSGAFGVCTRLDEWPRGC